MGLGASFALGLLAGSRSMSAPAVANRIAKQRRTHMPGDGHTGLGSVGSLLFLLAAGEMIADKLPFVPDRRKPPSFAWRVASGALSGGAVRQSRGELPFALLAGAAGAVAGTLGGSALRSKLAEEFGHDFPAALVEDALAAGIALLALHYLSTRDDAGLRH